MGPVQWSQHGAPPTAMGLVQWTRSQDRPPPTVMHQGAWAVAICHTSSWVRLMVFHMHVILLGSGSPFFWGLRQVPESMSFVVWEAVCAASTTNMKKNCLKHKCTTSPEDPQANGTVGTPETFILPALHPHTPCPSRPASACTDLHDSKDCPAWLEQGVPGDTDLAHVPAAPKNAWHEQVLYFTNPT
ncbi:hypothetical protein P7K49_012219, partial [Saguinus oedipus]